MGFGFGVGHFCSFLSTDTGVGTDPQSVAIDNTPMVKDGYGADNAALLVDHFEAFATKATQAKQSFLATIWFQNVHVRFTASHDNSSLILWPCA